jgi:cytochrome b6-f complex iron-sulfur subunit
MDSAVDAVPHAMNNGRRAFLADLVVTTAGVVGLGSLAARFVQYLYPVIPPEQVIEVAAGRRDAVPPNGGIVVALTTGHVALVDADGELRAFSAVCTHLGCIVKSEPTEHHALYCACHGGMFDRQGEVVGGPPPRPLPRYPVEVRDGQVFVKVTVRPPVVTA